MTLRLYMDHNVPDSITEGLARRGVDCLTALADGTHQLEDELLLRRATDVDRVLVTMDDDFLSIAAQWVSSGRRFTGVIYAHPLEITIGQAIRDLELHAKVLDPPEMHDRVERIPL